MRARPSRASRAIILAGDLYASLERVAAEIDLGVQPFVHLVLQEYLNHRKEAEHAES